jgi:outer membrane protein assembly factor BamA
MDTDFRISETTACRVEGARMERATGERLRWSLVARVPLLFLAASLQATCAGGGPGAQRYPELVPYTDREVRDVGFRGTEPFGEDTLLRIIETRPTGCNLLGLPFCIPFTDIGRQESRLDLNVLRRDADRIAVFFRSSGFFGTGVRPIVEPEGEESDGPVRVTFVVARGDSVLVDSLSVAGTDTILDPDSLARALPLQPGELFDIGEFTASADTVLGALLARGHAYAQVLRNFTVDTATDRADVSIEAVPGPQVRIDSIIVRGGESIGRRAILRRGR